MRMLPAGSRSGCMMTSSYSRRDQALGVYPPPKFPPTGLAVQGLGADPSMRLLEGSLLGQCIQWRLTGNPNSGWAGIRDLGND